MAGNTVRGGLDTLVQTRRALMRAAAIFGSLALVVVFVIGGTMEERSSRFAHGSPGLDEMATGSIGQGERYTVRRSVLQAPGSGPCLYFPDGSIRGAC
ncbi:hypothetical protein [Aureimonas populi]|uniref:Uncharacterized protein n=1 Tax=Aureimonas populi TaxID=1701758 RepID=A0ABW5CH92_9HYPH|nr:hypothetical protein [Aureimonas populi]